MKTLMIIPHLLTGLMLASCQNVSLVKDRNSDGTYTSPISPKTGSAAQASATVYRFHGGDYGITVWTDGTLAIPTFLGLP